MSTATWETPASGILPTPRDLLRRALHELDLTAGVAAGIAAVAR